MDLLTGSLIYYPVVFVVVVGVSALSKRYFEDYFLSLKNKISIPKAVTAKK